MRRSHATRTWLPIAICLLGCEGGEETCEGAVTVCNCPREPKAPHVWSHAYGDGETQRARAVAADGTNVLLTGDFEGNVDLGGGALTSAGDDDIYLAKLDAVGAHLWSRSFGNPGCDRPRDLAVDGQGNLLLAGEFNGSLDFGGGPLSASGNNCLEVNIFLVKLSPNGDHLWSHEFGGSGSPNCPSDRVRAVAVDRADNVLITGFINCSSDFGGGVIPPDETYGGSYFAKFAPDGSHVWSKSFGSSTGGYDVETDDAGNVFIAGYFRGSTLDLDGAMLTSSAPATAFVAKLTPDGNHVWSKKIDYRAADTYELSIDVDPIGNLVVAGGLFGSADFGDGPIGSPDLVNACIAKMSPDGALVWSGCHGSASLVDVATDAQGALVVTGKVNGSLDFGGGDLNHDLDGNGDVGIYVAKLDAEGRHIWSGNPSICYPGFSGGDERAVAIDANDDVLLTGTFEGTIDFGGGLLESTGFGEDVFAAKLAAR